eukprot:scaffold4536_cov113-Isochrysis_galbana.AAC.1
MQVGFCRRRHRVGRHTQKNVAIHPAVLGSELGPDRVRPAGLRWVPAPGSAVACRRSRRRVLPRSFLTHAWRWLLMVPAHSEADMAGLRAAFARVARLVPLLERDRQHSLQRDGEFFRLVRQSTKLPLIGYAVCFDLKSQMLQLAYCIGRPVLGYEEVGATDARRIGPP